MYPLSGLLEDQWWGHSSICHGWHTSLLQRLTDATTREEVYGRRNTLLRNGKPPSLPEIVDTMGISRGQARSAFAKHRKQLQAATAGVRSRGGFQELLASARLGVDAQSAPPQVQTDQEHQEALGEAAQEPEGLVSTWSPDNVARRPRSRS